MTGSGSVTNYDKTYLGRVSLSRAMVSSDNSVYAQLTDLVGPKAIVKTSHSLGIRSRLAPYFSIGLGSVAVSPLEMARAYATLANEGRRVDGSVFDNRAARRQDGRARSLEQGRRERADPDAGHGGEPRGAPHGHPRGRRPVRDRASARRSRAARSPGKTGTTDNYGDAWFVGYTPELVVAVWVGYPDALKPMLTEFNGEPVAGGTLPAMIWKEFVEKLDEDDDLSFDSPPYLGGVSTWVVQREGEWQLDNGYCRERATRRVLLRARTRHGGGLQAQRGVRAARRRNDEGRSGGRR